MVMRPWKLCSVTYSRMMPYVYVSWK